MTAKFQDERLNEKADEVFNLLVEFIHATTCDSLRCMYDGEFKCVSCRARPLVAWITGGDDDKVRTG